MKKGRPNTSAVLVKQLQSLAKACATEAEWCEAAQHLAPDPLMAKNAASWRAREAVCRDVATRLRKRDAA